MKKKQKLSKQIHDLAGSQLPDESRLQVLIFLTAKLALKLERDEKSNGPKR